MANPRMTAEIGRVLGGRYRLVAPIGMGASAQVYLADDVKLRRRVAVKMLHDALAGDAEFLRRFRAEARAAAALSHPNVMAVYDWSDGTDEGEAAFIVTEYLPGGSLRALLDTGALLSPSQALGVGLEAARALDYAHRRGFVHRDIKPANLLFGEEQRLRIADFGLARALAEAAWTEPQGAVLGTARYASPEQAKGERLTGKADVYALALVLIEAVTGSVPFGADTTLGTLMARVDRDLEVPDALGPLQSVLVGAGHPDPAQRIDARTLATGLLRAARSLSRPGPLPLAGALAAGAAAPDLDPTVHAPSGAEPEVPSDLTAEDLELDPPHWVNQAEPPMVAPVPIVAAMGPGIDLADGPEPAPEPEAEPEPEEPLAAEADPEEDAAEPEPDAEPEAAAEPAPEEPVDTDPTVVAAAPAPVERLTEEVPLVGAADPVVAEDDPDEPGRRRRWPWVLLAVVVLAIAGGAAAAALASRDAAPEAPPVALPVPSLVDRTEADATAVAEASGWKVTVVRKRQNDTIRGQVLATSPAAGERLADGRTLTITVSDGQQIIDLPAELAGATLEEATAALEAVGLSAEVTETPYSEDVAKDVVIGVAEGTPGKIERGSTVGLVVSNGPEPRVVPSGLVGSSEEEAVAALEELGLKAAIVRSYSDSVDEGTVISVLPAAGTTVPRGETINVEVSRGPELIAVPDVSGAGSISEAISILSGAGLQDGSVSGPASGTPQGTSPGAGALVRPGSTVDIILG